MTKAAWMAWGVAAGVAAFGAGSSARAQQVVGASAAPGVVIGSPVVGPVWSVGAGAPSSMGAAPVIMPYSYYARFPEPARVYVGYGPNDGFSYQGQAYGHAGDRWSWAAMSTGNGSLARYYYQILP